MIALSAADSLVVAEIFGPTWQGEGPSLGRQAMFIRLGGCNLTCSWCDAAYTWDARRYDLRAELARVSISEIQERVLGVSCPMVVITGGEPLLHQTQRSWYDLLASLSVCERRIEVETNGTISPSATTAARVTQFNVSPKLPHAGVPPERAIKIDVLKAFQATRKAILKFVCRTPEDVTAADDIARAAGFPRNQVWIMPEGTDTATITEVAQRLAPRALGYGFNLTTRLHIQLWGDKRGH